MDAVAIRLAGMRLLGNSARPCQSADGLLHAKLKQGFHPVADGMDRGLMARIENQDGRGDEFVFRKLLPLGFGPDQGREQVIAQILAPLLHQPAHVIAERHGGRDGGVLHRPVAPRHVHGHHVMRPAQKLVCHVGGHAEQLADHDDRNGRGIGRQQVDFTLCLKADRSSGWKDSRFWAAAAPPGATGRPG